MADNKPRQELIVPERAALSDVQEVSREVTRAKEGNLFSGWLAILRAKRPAWVEERVSDHTQHRLQARQKVAEAEALTIKAEQARDDARRKRILADVDEITRPTITFVPQAQVPPPAAVTQHISREEIDRMVVRAAMLLGPEDTNEEQWEEYRGWLRSFPPHVAQEVENKVSEMRRKGK